MLEAAPLPWLPCHVRSWLFYVQRCCGEGRPYWYPDHATGRLGSMSQKCKAPGSAALAKMVGCSRKVAQRLIDSTKAPSRAKVQNGPNGGQLGVKTSTKTSASTGRGGAKRYDRGTNRYDTPKAVSRAAPPKPASGGDTREPRKTPIERGDRNKAPRRNRSGRNLATMPAPIAPGFKPTAQQIDGSWAHIRKLARSHPDTMPRSLHPRSSKHMALLRAVRRLGDGDQRIGWRRAVELRQRACMVPGEGSTPEEWANAYTGDTP